MAFQRLAGFFVFGSKSYQGTLLNVTHPLFTHLLQAPFECAFRARHLGVLGINQASGYPQVESYLLRLILVFNLRAQCVFSGVQVYAQANAANAHGDPMNSCRLRR